MLHSPALLAGFVGLVLAMLALDLGVVHRRGIERPPRVTALLSLAWIALALGFAVTIHLSSGHVRMLEFVTGYLIEYSLSIDNLFVFLAIFAYFRVPTIHQHRVLLWGILSAVCLRLLFVLAGAALLRSFHWSEYVLGAFLLLTALRMLRRGREPVDPERSRLVRAFRRFVPSVPGFCEGRFLVCIGGRPLATMLLLVLVLIEATDVVVALHSIPAIFAVTSDPLIVFAANGFAVVGLRSLHSVLSDFVQRLPYLHLGLGGVLLFVSAKLLLHDVLHVPIWASLALIFTILALATGFSLVRRPTDVSR